MSEQCKEKIFHTWSSRNCSRKAVTDGYCKQHHPDSVKAARLKSEEKWARERENTPLAVARRTIESQERRIKELENGLIAADDVYGVWYNESEDILVAKDRDIAELVAMLNKVEDLMTDSVGVEGLHMGGDLATWDSLLTGGFYEDWLGGFNELLDKHTGAE